MTDELGLAPEAPAALPPAAPVDDIEARLTAKMDERYKGFQRLLAEKDEALSAARQEALDLRMSTMSEDEVADLEWTQLQNQVQQLQAENALLALQSEYPDELPAFKKLLNASDPKEQLDIIRALRAAQASAASSSQADSAESEPEIPEIDPNNPPPLPRPSGPVYNGREMTEDWADRILASVKRMR